MLYILRTPEDPGELSNAEPLDIIRQAVNKAGRGLKVTLWEAAAAAGGAA